MGVLDRLFSRPGYYELVGGPQVGKTTVALLLATSKLGVGRTVFVTTQEEYSPLVTEVVTGEERPFWLVTVSGVADFFELVKLMRPGQLLVLDSLATLRPDHPASTQIASSINRHIVVSPPCPVLVVNQERFPVASGGSMFRAVRSGVFRLVKYRDRPFLLSALQPTSLYLVWKGKPELRMLVDEERKVWLGGGIEYV